MLRLKKDGKVIARFRSWTDMTRFIIKKYRLKNFAGFKSMKTRGSIVDLELQLAEHDGDKAKQSRKKTRKKRLR